jgi:hypothetical protein
LGIYSNIYYIVYIYNILHPTKLLYHILTKHTKLYRRKMSRKYEERLIEWTKWFHAHVDDGMSLPKRVEFLQRAIDGCLELLVMVAQDERAMMGSKQRSLLWTPKMGKTL